MFENIKSNDKFIRVIIFLLLASIGILALSIITESSDTRHQIIDLNGGQEELCSVLSNVKGTGEVDILVEYKSDNTISGVIIVAEGGSDPVIANNLTKGVCTLYDIPASSVIVFEKEEGK